MHAPTFAAGPETSLAGVWSRTGDSAARLAAAYGVPSFARVEDLLDACDAVACAVPPTVQPGLAALAAGAGKAVLLEKPIAADLVAAERLADEIGEAGVASMVMLTYRFNPAVEAFLRDAASFDATGARACFLSGALLGGAYHRSAWRRDLGALVDVGPHVLDLVDAALGPITGVTGTAGDWSSLVCEHATGAVSSVSISCSVAIAPSRTEVELFGRGGSLGVDARAGDRFTWFAAMRRRFAEVAAAGPAPHALDVVRGLHLQGVIARALRGTGPS